MANPTVRSDFYQRENKVRLNLFAKNLDKESTSVHFTASTLQVKFHLPSGEIFHKTYQLFRNVDPEKCWFKVLSTKIEVELFSVEFVKWTSIEISESDPSSSSAPAAAAIAAAPMSPTAVDTDINKYPTSGKTFRDWDKIEAEVVETEKNEKKEGDEGLNSLFQQIFKDGTPEQQKAMMKSFTESGGTVLSTNWDEVKEKNVAVQPPDGMEFKKWDG
jgi:suppressor of G2 allele of SKP1